MPFLEIMKSGNVPKQQKFKEAENGRESKDRPTHWSAAA
jgi:hypothetical protein